MPEFELAELGSTAMSNPLTSFTIFISVATAYVIAAFAAGRNWSPVFIEYLKSVT